MADVTAVLHAVETDLVNNFVGAFLRGARVVAQCGHAQHPSAAGHHILVAQRGAGMEHMEIIANGFLVGIIWLSIFIGKPFTLQYARAELPRERWYDENLVKGCLFIAVFWGALLLIPAAASIYRLYHPLVLPSRFYFFLSLSCIITGVIFTSLYKRMKRQQRQSAE